MSRWNIQNIGNLAFVKGGKRLPKGKDYTPEVTKHPYLRVVDFNNNSIDVSKLKYLSNETASQIERYTISCEDVYISIAGTIGLVGTIPPECDKANLTENAAKLVIKDKSIIDKNYLITYLSSTVGQKQIKTKIIATTQPKLALFRIEELEIPLPPLETQKQIAKTLDTAAELLAMRKQQLAELDGLIRSTFYDMFGDPVNNEKGWKVEILGEVAPIQQSEQKTNQKNAWLLNMDAVESNSGRIIGYNYVTRDCIGNSTIIFDETNVLYSKLRPYLNKVVLPCQFGFATSELLPLKPVPNILKREYLTYFLRSNEFVSFISEKVAGAKMPRVVVKEFKEYRIPIPPLDLQTQFASIVAKIEEQKALVKKAIDETQYLFDSLMSEYFE